MIRFQATGVYEDTYNALNERIRNDQGKYIVKYKIIVQEGSSRSSKTWSDFQVIFMYASENRLKHIAVLRDVAVDCHDNVEKDFISWMSDPMGRMKQYEDGDITIDQALDYIDKEDLSKQFIRNKQKHSWTHKETKSVIVFTGLDSEDKAMGYRNDLCWINEPYSFSEEIFRQLLQRNKQIIFDWNPKTEHFINKYKGKKNTIVLKSTFRDNPFCPEEAKEQLLSYQPVKYADVVLQGLIKEKDLFSYNFEENKLLFTKKQIKEAKRCIENENPDAFTASDYHYMVYCLGIGAEKPNRIYKGWREISDETFDKLPFPNYYGLDFGSTNPSALVEVKYDNKENAFFIKLRMHKPMSEMKSNDGHGIVSELEKLGLKKNLPIICDSSDKDNRLIIQRNGYNIIPAVKGAGSVAPGITLCQQSKIYYVKDKQLFDEYEEYEWEVVKGINLDRPIKKNDHALDAMRYIITWLYKYLGIK